jgi:tetratricopeptide (TPR) repeat protein
LLLNRIRAVGISECKALYNLGKKEAAKSCFNEEGLFFFQMGRYNESIRGSNGAISIDPNYAGAWNNKARALEKNWVNMPRKMQLLPNPMSWGISAKPGFAD